MVLHIDTAYMRCVLVHLWVQFIKGLCVAYKSDIVEAPLPIKLLKSSKCIIPFLSDLINFIKLIGYYPNPFLPISCVALVCDNLLHQVRKIIPKPPLPSCSRDIEYWNDSCFVAHYEGVALHLCPILKLDF